MKRVFGTSLFTFIFLTILNAKTINLFTAEKPAISIRQNLQINFFEDSKEKNAGFSTITDVDFQELYATLGTALCDGLLDLTASVRYTPTFGDRLKFGIESTYHLFYYPENFVEHDFLLDACLRWNACSFFQFDLTYGLSKKYSIVDEVKKNIPVFGDTGMNFLLMATFFPGDLWKLYCSFATYSYFNYPLFLSAFISTGMEYELIPGKIGIGLDFSTKWYDFIVVAKNPGQINATIYGRYKI